MLLIVCPLAAAPGQAAAAVPVMLREACPTGFSLLDDGTCAFRSPYSEFRVPPRFANLYRSLPAPRAGFTPEQIDLGRYLFFDPLLSGDHGTSCAHCHHPRFGLTDGRGRSVGAGGSGFGPARSGGKILARGAPTLWNVAFLNRLFLDGRARSLEQQAVGPLFTRDEMANSPGQLERDLNGSSEYRRLFREAYGLDRGAPVTTDLVIRSLVAFESSLISLNSPYDRYIQGDDEALNAQEKRGFELFHSFATRCAHCHTPPLFTDDELAVIGAPDAAGQPFDAGAGSVTGDVTLRGAFRTPSLRNIARTAPYMHSGALEDLRAAVEFYNKKPGHAVPAGQRVLLHWLMSFDGPRLGKEDILALVAFLESLTDESLMPEIPGRVPSGLPVAGAGAPEAGAEASVR